MLPPQYRTLRLQRTFISRPPRGFSTCCLRFKNDVATIPARLASGWLASLYREGVEPSGIAMKGFQGATSLPGFILTLRHPKPVTLPDLSICSNVRPDQCGAARAHRSHASRNGPTSRVAQPYVGHRSSDQRAPDA